MDRQMVYAGSIPLDSDLLNIQLHVLRSIGALARTVLGRDCIVDGMGCVPNGNAYSVTVRPGSFTVPYTTDTHAFGALPPDGAETMRTALLRNEVSLQLGPPPDGDHAICWLIQAGVQEVDTGALALPYYNAANPAVAWSGPANSGQAQATQRVLRVVVSAKASAPQAGTFVPPDPDPGNFGLYKVTTFYARPVIPATDVVRLPGAPMLRFPLPLLPPGFTQLDTYDSNNVWIAPDGVRHARVRLVGGGGGGGGGDSGFSGGGGGAGGYAESLVSVVPGGRYGVVVGVGGFPGATGSSGTTGGVTSFGSLVSATGGDGGGSANPNSYGGAPGVGTAGVLLQRGGYGTDGAKIGKVPAGAGGASAFGGGGRGADQGGLPAIGQAKGSGGGGGYGAGSAGGSGAGGLVLVEY